MNEARYSELKFLNALASDLNEFNCFDCNNQRQQNVIGLGQQMYLQMAAALIEDLYVRFEDSNMQRLVPRLRGELINADLDLPPTGIADYLWNDPRKAIEDVLSRGSLQRLRVTYRGLRRIEELRDLLKRDRILEDFGVLLSIRYFRRDFEDALHRSPDFAVSVIYADMDNFGPINKKFSHAAGDVVMKAYLEIVHDCISILGESYRGVGDETCALILGQGHQKAVELAETIRKRVGELQCNYKDILLPKVTASIGVASTPPGDRSLDVETCAQSRQRKAKELGKNRVVTD